MNSNNSSSGLGRLDVLQLIFLVLKLAKLVDWSWWAVFSPTIVGLVLTILGLIILNLLEV